MAGTKKSPWANHAVGSGMYTLKDYKPTVKVTLFPLVICGVAEVCAKIAKPVVASSRTSRAELRCTAQENNISIFIEPIKACRYR